MLPLAALWKPPAKHLQSNALMVNFIKKSKIKMQGSFGEISSGRLFFVIKTFLRRGKIVFYVEVRKLLRRRKKAGWKLR